MKKLIDKVVIVTGGSGLIGSAILKTLKEQGAIVINADLHKSSDEFLYYSVDITSEQSMKNLVSNIVKDYGRIDGLVNNAYPRTKDWGTKFEQIPFDSWKQNVDFQLNSYFFMSQEVLGVMANQHSGSIVNIGSTYGIVGPDFTVYEGTQMTMPAAYSAIKGGLINFTRYLAAYYGPNGIRVNCVSPGGVFDNQPESFVQRYEAKVPLRRMAKASDMGPAIAFLLSDDAGYITGQNLAVDGGWTAI